MSGRRTAAAGFAASGRTSALFWWCRWVSSVWSRRCWFCLWIHAWSICLCGALPSSSCRAVPACPLLPGAPPGSDATGDLKTPRSCSGCSCQAVCSSERLSPALWGRSSQKEERFLQGEGLRGNSTGRSARVHVSLGISIRALLPQPQRKDASIYLQLGEWDLHQPPIAPSELPYQTGASPGLYFGCNVAPHGISWGEAALGHVLPQLF